MSWKKVFAVIRREYLERVRTKAFWIGTFLVPIFFLGYIAINIASFKKSGGERRVAVVDMTGRLYQPLARDLVEREEKVKKDAGRGQGVHWVLEARPVSGSLEQTKETLRREVLGKKLNVYLILDPALLEKSQVQYYSVTVSEFVAMSQLERAVNHILLKEKIERRGLPPELSSELEKRIDLKTLKVTAKGSTEEKGAGIFAAMIFMILMYTTFFMYGFQNLRGVIEEKTSRIVELIIASVRPTELMLGKIVGIGCVGLTQYLIWSLIAANLSLPGVAGMVAAGEMGVPTIPVSAVLNNPNGPVATFVSLFPLTSPLMMFLRTAVAEPPVWQVALSMVILALSTVAMAWIAGRIYRVGILMYGKKPTIPEILRWVRYKPGQAPQPAAAKAT